MILVVIPALNEANTIGKIVKKISKSFKVLVVDDGSKDKTSEEAKKNGAKVITSKKNYGVDYSIDLGFNYAIKKKFKFLITFDADNQHYFKDLKRIANILKKDKSDLVIGVRSNFPRISEKIFSFYTLKKFNIRDLLTGLKGYNLEIYKKYGTFCSFKSIGTELAIFAIKNQFKVSEIKIDIRDRDDKPRIGGLIKANYRIFKSLIQVLYKT